MMKRVGIVCILMLLAAEISAQTGDVYIGVHEREQSAYLYHFLTPPLGHGVMIYRSTEAGSFDPITEEPVMPLMRANLLEAELGSELYNEIRTFLNRDDEAGTFFALRTNRELSRFLTVFRPEVADLLGRRFIDTDAPIGRQATYRFQVVNDQGVEIGDPVEHTQLLEPVLPAQPDQITAVQDEGWIELNWSYRAPAANNRDDVISFRIMQQTEGTEPVMAHENPIARDADSESFRYRVPLQQPGTRYTFFVEAVDIIGQSTRSTESATITTVDPAPPVTVRGLRGRFTDGRDVALSWYQSPDPGVVGYRVYRSVDTHNNYTQIVEELISANEPYFNDTVPADSRYYFYRVTAVNEYGNESDPGNFTSVFVPDRTPPPAPQQVVAEFNEEAGIVEVRWEDPSPADDLLTYLVVRRISAEGSSMYARINSENVRNTQYLDEGISDRGFVEGAFYSYGVAAADSSMNISDTLFVDVQIPGLTPPEAPSQLTARTNGRQVSLTWSQSLSTDVINYKLTRSGGQPDDSFEKLLPRHQITFTDREVVRGASYRYEIAAVDSFDNVSLNPPVQEILVADGNRPPIVRNVHLVPVDEGAVEIRWAEVRSGNLAGYRIYRSEISATGYELVAKVDANSIDWQDELTGNRMWYRIRAVDEFGNVSMPSAPVSLRQQ